LRVTYSVWDNHLYQLKQTMLNKRAVELVYCTNKAHKLINGMKTKLLMLDLSLIEITSGFDLKLYPIRISFHLLLVFSRQ
jgi:hypothetical protein